MTRRLLLAIGIVIWIVVGTWVAWYAIAAVGHLLFAHESPVPG